MANHQSGRFSIQEAFHPLQLSFILSDATSVAQVAFLLLSEVTWIFLFSPQADQSPVFFLFCAHFSRRWLNLHFGVISAPGMKRERCHRNRGCDQRASLQQPSDKGTPSAPKTATFSINYASPFLLVDRSCEHAVGC